MIRCKQILWLDKITSLELKEEDKFSERYEIRAIGWQNQGKARQMPKQKVCVK